MAFFIINVNGEIMSKKQKMIIRLKSKPKDFTFDEMETLLLSLGFRKSNKGRTSGSKVIFLGAANDIILHKPHPRNELKPYQVNHVLDVLKLEGKI